MESPSCQVARRLIVSSSPAARVHRLGRRSVVAMLTVAGLGAVLVGSTRAAAQGGQQIVTEDGRVYDAYVPAATKSGQYFHFTCEFDAAWAVLATFGHEVSFEDQLALVGHDTSIEPYYEETTDGYLIHGADISRAYNGDYDTNFLARCTGAGMLPLFQHYGLEAYPAQTREAIEEATRKGGLVWIKATVDFLPWAASTWVAPDGKRFPTVLGNDHAVVVMGYNDYGVVIRDVLGPTDTNWERQLEYDVPWETFLGVFEAQGSDGVAVLAGTGSTESAPSTGNTIQPVAPSQPAAPS